MSEKRRPEDPDRPAADAPHDDVDEWGQWLDDDIDNALDQALSAPPAVMTTPPEVVTPQATDELWHFDETVAQSDEDLPLFDEPEQTESGPADDAAAEQTSAPAGTEWGEVTLPPDFIDEVGDDTPPAGSMHASDEIDIEVEEQPPPEVSQDTVAEPPLPPAEDLSAPVDHPSEDADEEADEEADLPPLPEPPQALPETVPPPAAPAESSPDLSAVADEAPPEPPPEPPLEATPSAERQREPLVLDVLPLEKAARDDSWATDYGAFKTVTRKLARLGGWRQLAAITGHALLNAPYAEGVTRTALLLDLARIYRDRLDDAPRAQQTFAALANEEPANGEAIEYLVEEYQRRRQWGAIFDLYLAAVEATWDPNERLDWTRAAAELAVQQMNQVDLAIKAWENLWRLGDGADEAARELSVYYRIAGRWAEMGAFLAQRAERQGGAAQLVTLRELAEVKLSGAREPHEAREILEQIVQHRPRDPIATLQLARVYAQRKDWEALARLSEEAPPAEESAFDLQQLIADALWRGDQLAQAVEVYDRILATDPLHAEATARKREYLTKAGRHDQLLGLLVAKADSSEEIAQRTALLAEAAVLAEEKVDDAQQAAQLWESLIALDSDNLPAFEALARLYESLGDLPGIARAMEGQLRLTKERGRRIELLRQLGQHYAKRMGDDDKAEQQWKEILALAPADLPVREELIELHRRRGDFEALNSALLRQIWLTDNEQRAEELSRRAAQNLDENFDDPQRSIEAWRRVLDYAPLDMPALEALARHYGKLERHRELIATLEQQIRAVEDARRRTDLALKIAELWEKLGVAAAAAATYERVLRWDPINAVSISALVRIYAANGQPGKAAGVLDHASVLAADDARRVELLQRATTLIAKDAHVQRFFHLRRILSLSGDTRLLDDLAAEAAADPSLWPEMAAVLVQLISEQTDPQSRLDLLRHLASICEEKLNNHGRAYLALQTTLLAPESHAEVLEDLERLGAQTKRHEDLLALLDRLTTPEFPLADRKRIVRQRARICETELNAPLRAFHEIRRLLELDSVDWEPLRKLEQLAEQHGLWSQLDAVCTQLWDRTTSPRDRVDVLQRREEIARNKIGSRESAFDMLVRLFRIDADDVEVLRSLTTDAAELSGWRWLLPLVEAVQLAPRQRGSAQELAVTAALYEEKLEDLERAFVLYSEAFVIDPRNVELVTKLEQLADQIGRFDDLADAFRMAAASSEERELTSDLLRRIAAIYEQKLEQPARAIDVHRRLLDLHQDELRSLEVMIEWHREQQQWRDLRDRLQQWVHLAPDGAPRVPKLVEIGQISERQLDDPESALEAYGLALEIEPQQAEARAGLEGLISAITEPGLRLRWLRMELAGATGQQAIDLRLEISRIQREDLEDQQGAVGTLRGLIEDHGADGPGFAPLARLLRELQRHQELVLLLQQRAERVAAVEDKLASLDEALRVCHEHFGDGEPELRESLYRATLALRPDDHEIRVRLARLLRDDGRFQDLCALLEQQLEVADDLADQVRLLGRLARIEALNLGQPEKAEERWRRVLEIAPQEEGALLALARFALDRGAHDSYLELRLQQARLLPAAERAHTLCHLAEFCDETAALKKRMIPLYREARAADPDNIPAMEALKGIGRRRKNLRPAAALLPLEGERDLAPADRALRLKVLGDESLGEDLLTAVDWYRRAVAIAPDDASCWDALASALERLPDPDGGYRATRAWLQAIERCEPLDPAGLENEAARLYALALRARAAGDDATHTALVRQAHEIAPRHAPSALSRAEALIGQERIDEAHRLLEEVLIHYGEQLTDEQRVAAHRARGITLRQQGLTAEAVTDLREALEIQPLNADCLVEMGEAQHEAGRVAAALEYMIRALVVVKHSEQRAELYFRIGKLWEDELGALDEAGACYEQALAEGLEARDLFHRALLHYQRTGRLDESLQVVDGLLPTAEEPQELATLWQVRGEILAARDGGEDEAIEAFDMALSYEPTHQKARDGLVAVLERRGDWNQLLQVLEASCDAGTAEQRADALRRMALISRERMGEPARAEEYLRQAVSALPTREALEELEQLYGDDDARRAERQEVLGLLVGFGPPYFERVLQLAQLVLDEDKPWAWTLLSPLLGVSQIDAEIKSLIQEMRREYEKPPLRCAQDEDLALLKHPEMPEALAEVLAELETFVEIGVTSLDSASPIAIAPQTTLGKTFAAMSQAMDLPDCALYRAQELPQSLMIVNGDPPSVVMRTDVMQQLVHAEVGFVFAYALTLTQPGHRGTAALPPEQRAALIPALWRALDLSKTRLDSTATSLADRLREAVEEPLRNAWRERLGPLGQEDPVALGERWWRGLCFTARRAGLLAGADLRQTFRVVARIEESVDRPRVVARLQELDEYVAASEILEDLVAFAAAPVFGHLINNALTAEVD